MLIPAKRLNGWQGSRSLSTLPSQSLTLALVMEERRRSTLTLTLTLTLGPARKISACFPRKERLQKLRANMAGAHLLLARLVLPRGPSIGVWCCLPLMLCL